MRAFGTLQDITELRHAQEELSASELLTRHIFENAPDAMAVIGRDYRYQRLNPVYERSWKMPADRIVGLHVSDLHGSEVFEQILKPNMDRCFAGEQVSFAEWFVNTRRPVLLLGDLRATAVGLRAGGGGTRHHARPHRSQARLRSVARCGGGARARQPRDDARGARPPPSRTR